MTVNAAAMKTGGRLRLCDRDRPCRLAGARGRACRSARRIMSPAAPWRWPRTTKRRPGGAVARRAAGDPSGDHRGGLRCCRCENSVAEPHLASAAPRRRRCAGRSAPGASGWPRREAVARAAGCNGLQNSATSGSAPGRMDGSMTGSRILVSACALLAAMACRAGLRPEGRPRHALRGRRRRPARTPRRPSSRCRRSRTTPDKDKPFILDPLLQ